MGDKIKIEWTDASWNPTTGCTKISAGCTYCYAEQVAIRMQKRGIKKYENAFKLTLHPDTLEIPLKWKKPRKIFVNSMSDLFHKDISFDFIDKVWEVMIKADWHIYQILTKRPEIMKRYIEERRKVTHALNTSPKHIWLGTSIEDAKVKNRLDILREIPAGIRGIRFVSFEPLIGDVGELNLDGIQWVIVGGESGEHHRPIKEEWVLSILNQAKEKGVAFFFKQWGGLTSKSGGRTLQGKIYDEYPMVLA